jgi:hypothetical protein
MGCKNEAWQSILYLVMRATQWMDDETHVSHLVGSGSLPERITN